MVTRADNEPTTTVRTSLPQTGAPVRLMLDREEEHLSVGNRPSSDQLLCIGAKKDVEITIHLVSYTPAGAAMRAPGHPQGAFALEQIIDELAVKLNMDPMDLHDKTDEDPVRRE
jgi:xanthine dehydrogenase YagR molybdenum-binding subunit